MPKILAWKLARLLILFWGITLVSFWVVHLAPGTAAESMAGFDPAFGSQAR